VLLGRADRQDAASQKYIDDYDGLLAQAASGSSLNDTERELLREILTHSPEVVHLQSGHGLDDVSLVRCGARRVVGVDFSMVAVRVARTSSASPAGTSLARFPECRWPARTPISSTPATVH